MRFSDELYLRSEAGKSYLYCTVGRSRRATVFLRWLPLKAVVYPPVFHARIRGRVRTFAL